MDQNDAERFFKIWNAAHGLVGKSPPPEAVELAFDILRGYTLDDIEKAVKAHLTHPELGQYPIKPADVARALAPKRNTWLYR